jgi:hypothetical protein
MLPKYSESGIILCIVCEKEMPDYVPRYCCDGRDCGCYGQPIDPPICSDNCMKEIMKR